MTKNKSELGEFSFIEKITKNFEIKNSESLLGVGDDSAIIESSKLHMLVSKDLLVEGIHFDLSYTPLKHLGYKSVIVNLSDIYAMNGIPKQIVVGIAISNRFKIESIEELYKGIKLACEKYKIDLVGGDTTTSQSGLTISITVLGQVKKETVVKRSGAKKNDLIVVTGDLGAAYLGLQVLKREKEIFLANPGVQPKLEGYDYILQRQLKPEAPKKYFEILNEIGVIPTSMIDISDGLSSELLHISKSSRVSVKIYEDKIPIDYTVMNKAAELNLNPIFCALNGGEDYELLFTIDQKEYSKLEKDPDFTIIGHITDKSEGNFFITNDNQAHELTAQGWDSLKSS